jgi:hypothetical protein
MFYYHNIEALKVLKQIQSAITFHEHTLLQPLFNVKAAFKHCGTIEI